MDFAFALIGVSVTQQVELRLHKTYQMTSCRTQLFRQPMQRECGPYPYPRCYLGCVQSLSDER